MNPNFISKFQFAQNNFLYFEISLFLLMPFSKANYQNIEIYSTYKRMDLYRREAYDISTYCSGFVCHRSGLSETRVLQIVNKENQIRNEYALVRNISNMYSVGWSYMFADFAREKIKLCLYPTTSDSIIFETEILNEWFTGDQKLDRPVALEVIISQKAVDTTKSETLDLYRIIEDEIENLFDDETFIAPSAVSRRGAALQMGCDYLVQNNVTHIIVNLLCVYGLIYFTDGATNDFVPIVGAACSLCDFYEVRPFYRFGRETETEKWACMPKYPYLCADLGTEEKSPVNYRYDCSGKLTTSRQPDVTWITVTATPLGSTAPPHIWPCYKYSIPVILLTLIVTAIICYQIYSLIVMKTNRDKK